MYPKTRNILIELTPYAHEEEGYSFDELITFFDERGYRFFDANGGKDVPVDAARLRTIIPDGGCINVLASPAAAEHSVVNSLQACVPR